MIQSEQKETLRWLTKSMVTLLQTNAVLDEKTGVAISYEVVNLVPIA